MLLLYHFVYVPGLKRNKRATSVLKTSVMRTITLGYTHMQYNIKNKVVYIGFMPLLNISISSFVCFLSTRIFEYFF